MRRREPMTWLEAMLLCWLAVSTLAAAVQVMVHHRGRKDAYRQTPRGVTQMPESRARPMVTP